MVIKLLKREFAYYAKTLLLFEGILLCVACLNRLLMVFSTENYLVDMAVAALMMIGILGSVACVVVAFVLIVIRFYKNLFTAEGYLMFTLPVTETQHLLAKLIAGTVAMLSAIVAAVLDWLIIFSYDDFFVEFTSILSELDFLLDQWFIEAGGHVIAYAVEVIVLLLLALMSSILFYYMCIALGQATKIKNRILAAVGIYFLLNTMGQFLTPLLTELSIEFNDALLGEWIIDHPLEGLHIELLLGILVYGVLTVVYFAVIRYIMRRKLNLE